MYRGMTGGGNMLRGHHGMPSMGLGGYDGSGINPNNMYGGGFG